jgi:hypothetical protein
MVSGDVGVRCSITSHLERGPASVSERGLVPFRRREASALLRLVVMPIGIGDASPVCRVEYFRCLTILFLRNKALLVDEFFAAFLSTFALVLTSLQPPIYMFGGCCSVLAVGGV